MSGKIHDVAALLEFVEDVLFVTPSAVAAVVYCNNAEGHALGKTADGRTLDDVEEVRGV